MNTSQTATDDDVAQKSFQEKGKKKWGLVLTLVN